MIKLMHVEGFGCLKNVEVELTPLHAFIGPNDSGKSSLLKSIHALAQYVNDRALRDAPYRRYFPDGPGRLTLRAVSASGVECGILSLRGAIVQQTPVTRNQQVIQGESNVEQEELAQFLGELASTRIARFDPDALRSPSSLVRLDAPESFFALRGNGLSGILGSIFLRGDEEPIARIRREVQTMFPGIRRVGPVSVGPDAVELEAVLVDGTKVHAPEMSEGLLYYLAFFVLQYLESVSILLIEEPENGLHPSRIADVMRVLRNLTETKRLQVIISTHSPLLINELKPEEVSIVTRPNAGTGTVVTRMSRTPNFEERSRVLNLGELWLSYANGKDEAELLNEPPAMTSI